MVKIAGTIKLKELYIRQYTTLSLTNQNTGDTANSSISHAPSSAVGRLIRGQHIRKVRCGRVQARVPASYTPPTGIGLTRPALSCTNTSRRGFSEAVLKFFLSCFYNFFESLFLICCEVYEHQQL